MHVGIAYLRWRGKRSRHWPRMRTCNLAYLARGPWQINSITENHGFHHFFLPSSELMAVCERGIWTQRTAIPFAHPLNYVVPNCGVATSITYYGIVLPVATVTSAIMWNGTYHFCSHVNNLYFCGESKLYRIAAYRTWTWNWPWKTTYMYLTHNWYRMT